MVRRGCIRPLVVKAIGGLSMMPSDTGAMPQKIHPNSGIGNARELLKSKGFEVVRGIVLLIHVAKPHLYLVGLRRSLVSLDAVVDVKAGQVTFFRRV